MFLTPTFVPSSYSVFRIAKKLKKAWVETAKIKSKWKAQKRREGIVSLRSGISTQADEGEPRGNGDEDDGRSEKFDHSDSDPMSQASLDRLTGTPSGDEADDAESDSPKLSSPPTRSPKLQPPNKQKRDNKKRPLPHNKNNSTTSATTLDDKPSVRDLFQKAYSKSSLHTYKSDPLRRGRNHQDRGRRGSSRGAAPTRGRGQPNMKLRMNAMLAKITEQTRIP